MGGTFVFARSIKMERLDWCRLGWVCGPVQPGARRLAILEGVIFPGTGQSFPKFRLGEGPADFPLAR